MFYVFIAVSEACAQTQPAATEETWEKWGNLRRKAAPSLVPKTINLMPMQDPKAVKKSVAEQLVSIIFHGEIDSQPAGALD